MFDPRAQASQAQLSLEGAVPPAQPLSPRAQFIIDNPESFLGLLSQLSYCEPNARYIALLRTRGFQEEAAIWERKYEAMCGGVRPEERSVVVQALRSHLHHKVETNRPSLSEI